MLIENKSNFWMRVTIKIVASIFYFGIGDDESRSWMATHNEAAE